MTDLEKIKIRIKKLFEHAESAKQLGNLHEAETFTKKANDLLLEYNLALVDVLMVDTDAGRDEFANWIYGEYVSYGDNQSGSAWKFELIGTLCRYNFTQFHFWRRWKQFKVFGRMENVDMTVWLYNYLSTGLLRLAQEKHVALSDHEKMFYNRYAFLKDFLLGAVKGLGHQLYEQRESQQRENNKVTSLMVISKDALKRFEEKTAPGIKGAKATKEKRVGHAYGDGYVAGKNYKINKPLTGGKDSKRLD